MREKERVFLCLCCCCDLFIICSFLPSKVEYKIYRIQVVIVVVNIRQIISQARIFLTEIFVVPRSLKILKTRSEVVVVVI